MAVTPAIFGRYDENILLGATWSASAPAAPSYSVATLGSLDPAQRVVWGQKSLVVSAAATASARGDVLAIPMHNLDAGAAVLSVSTDAGFSSAVTIPALLASRFPATLLVDLTALGSVLSRTSAGWHFTISGNSANVVLGGCVAVYQKRTFLGLMAGDNFAWEYHEREKNALLEYRNEYLGSLRYDYGTLQRFLDIVIRPNASGVSSIRDWFRASHGRAYPSLLWPDPTVTDGYVGLWPAQLDILHQTADYKPVSVAFEELSKGKRIV